MSTYKTPGVYIEEISKLPRSIAQSSTSIPAFIGYTEKSLNNNADLLLKPFKVTSLAEYEQFYGLAKAESSIEVTMQTTAGGGSINVDVNDPSPYLMYYALQLFFDNGGGPCYIVSVGNYNSNVISEADLNTGLDNIKKVDEVSLILFPDAINLASADQYYGLYKSAMQQCAVLKDRFTIMDVWISSDRTIDNIKTLRDFDFGSHEKLTYGAAYYPQLVTKLSYHYHDNAVSVIFVNDPSMTGTLAQLLLKNNFYYQQAKNAIDHFSMLMPPSPAIAGIYAQVDESRGVWKAPANVTINSVFGPTLFVTQAEQDKLNVDPDTGISIDAIRFFHGKGTLVWGARTLAGNDNEWRYVPVRRFLMMVEDSCKKATEQFVFEPNDATTWIKIQAMIESFLTLLWRQGALPGNTTRDAFFVHVGLGTTMTAQDILDGKMIIEIGMAAVRPAEFVILRFMHTMVTP